MKHRVTWMTVRVLAVAWALGAGAPLAVPSRDVLVGTYTYAWMGADLGSACGLSTPAVLTRVRLGSATFGADGAFALSMEERVSCPGAVEDRTESFDGAYVLEGDQLVLDLDPQAPGSTTWRFQMTWDHEVGTLAFDEEASPGSPGIGVLVRNAGGFDARALLGDHALVRMRQSQVSGGVEVRGSFGTLTFQEGGQYAQVVDWQTIGPAGSTSATSMSTSGDYEVQPNGTITLDGGLHVGAVTHDGSFGVLVRRAAFGSMFAVFARTSSTEETFWALDDMWWLALYGAGRDEFAPAEVSPYGESGVIDFDAKSGRVLIGHTEAWVDTAGGGTTDGFTFAKFSKVGGGAYELGVDPETRIPMRLGRAEDVLLFAEVSSPEDVWIGVAPRAWGPLVGDEWEIDVTKGGAQTLTVRAGAANAGRLYLVLGSLSGTFPGTSLGDLFVPLNQDGYLLHTKSAPDPPLSSSFGTLDDLGKASATFALPAGAWTSLVGRTVHHACVVFSPDASRARWLVSNSVPLAIGD